MNEEGNSGYRMAQETSARRTLSSLRARLKQTDDERARQREVKRVGTAVRDWTNKIRTNPEGASMFLNPAAVRDLRVTLEGFAAVVALAARGGG